MLFRSRQEAQPLPVAATLDVSSILCIEGAPEDDDEDDDEDGDMEDGPRLKNSKLGVCKKAWTAAEDKILQEVVEKNGAHFHDTGENRRLRAASASRDELESYPIYIYTKDRGVPAFQQTRWCFLDTVTVCHSPGVVAAELVGLRAVRDEHGDEEAVLRAAGMDTTAWASMPRADQIQAVGEARRRRATAVGEIGRASCRERV